MKWKNKGHEYDCLYQEISGKTKFYLFGAGDYGRQFLQIFGDEIKIEGFIDNDPLKQGTMIYDKPCFSLDEVRLSDDEGTALQNFF